MPVKLQKWGNSQGIRPARHVLEHAKIRVGDELDITVRDGCIIVVPLKRIRGKVNLRELVSRIPAGRAAAETDWGPPVGREEW